MGSSRDRRESSGDQVRRDQEVLRATRELAAYFRGRRTEREARGAVKIIKAFIREREKMDPTKRRPLPIGRAAQAESDKTRLKTHRRAKVRRKPVDGRPTPSEAATPAKPGEPSSDE